jgi:hypothetical protein
LQPPIYQRSPDPESCLFQGEILSCVFRYHLDIDTIDDAEPGFKKEQFKFAVVLTQSCDLAQDFRSRKENKPSQIPDVLFCQVPPAIELKTPELNAKIWDRVKINKDERYHFLEAVPKDFDSAGEGLPELGIDFKRYFTVPTNEVYARINRRETMRRTVLCSPYLEHLSSRFAYFLSRVGLPHDHISA